MEIEVSSSTRGTRVSASFSKNVFGGDWNSEDYSPVRCCGFPPLDETINN